MVVVALAVSTASATTATVFYRIFQPQPVHTLAAGGGGAPSQGHAEFAVVSNASEGFFGSLWIPTAIAVAGCLSAGNSQRCGSGLGGSDVRLQILGSAPTFPPILLGGDSEDQYTLGGNSFFRFAFELVVQSAIKRKRPHHPTGASDENMSQTEDVQASSNSSSFTLESIAPSPPLADQFGRNPLSAFGPIDALPVAEPLIDFSHSAPSPLLWVAPQPIGGVPEPTTWVMMLAGFASLGFAGYRASRKRVALTTTASFSAKWERPHSEVGAVTGIGPCCG